MAESLSLPTGGSPAVAVDPVAGEADFSRMMSGAAEGVSGSVDDVPAAPPKREPRTESPDPAKPRRGRPPKDVRARTRDAKPGENKGKDAKPTLAPKDFTGDLTAVGDALWLGVSAIPAVSPYAAIIHAHQPQLVDALNQGAQVHAGVRNYLDRMTSGAGNAWALQLGLVAVNIGMQSWQLLQNKELRDSIARGNAEHVQSYMSQLGSAMEAKDTQEAA